MKKKAWKYKTLGALGGGSVGGALGGLEGVTTPAKYRPKDRKGKKLSRKAHTTRQALKGAFMGGAVGLIGGSAADDFAAWEKHKKKWYKYDGKNYYKEWKDSGGRGSYNPFGGRNIEDDLSKINIKSKKGIKTKKEVKTKHRRAAFKHHPDRPGGDEQKMKDVNAAWENIQNSGWYEKLAFLRSRGVSKADCCMVKHAGAMDWVHGALDVAGLAPGIGVPFDLLNSAIYAGRGQKANAALSLAAAVPLAGYGANAVKAGKHINKATKAVKGVDKVQDVSKATKIMDAVKAPVKSTREATRNVVSKTNVGQQALKQSDKVGKGIADATGGGGKTTKAVQAGQVLVKGEKGTRPLNPVIDKGIDKAIDTVIK